MAASTQMRISVFERVTSWLAAIALFMGIIVGFLFLVWVTLNPSDLTFSHPMPPTKPGQTAGTETEERFETPNPIETESLTDESVDQLLDLLQTTSHLAVSQMAAKQVGESAGTPGGDPRKAGSGGEDDGDDIVPRFERWQLKFAAPSRRQYAMQLDFYGIELAAIGGVPGVDYASNLASGRTDVRHGESRDEDRLYFMWTMKGPLQRYDRELLQAAGVELGGRQILKFIPKELENELATLELEYAREHGHASVSEIRRTVFESQPLRGGYEFTILAQDYREPVE